MVGVPSSRGCTACRRQKKKCISDSGAPPCTRCARLGIECLELGQRRLKFQSENEKLAILVKSQGEQDATLTKTCVSVDNACYNSTSSGVQPVDRIRHQSIIQLPPSSDLTRLRALYIRSIDANADISVHLPWNFGPYLEQIPLYLGRNEAFDLAAEALTAAYSCIRRNIKPGRDGYSLGKYSKALKALAQNLNDKDEATSTETLATISMLIVFEAISGFGPESVLAHAGGAAKVFKERGKTAPKNEFEAVLQLSLRGAIIMQSLYLPSHYFTEEEWRGLTESQIGAQSPEEQAFRCFAVYARLMQKASALFEEVEPDDHAKRLNLLLEEAETLKDKLLPQLESLRQSFWHLTSALREIGNKALTQEAAVGKSVWDLNTYHSHIGRSYGFALATLVVINSLLQATRLHLVKHSDLNASIARQKNHVLGAESADIAREVCQLAKEVDYHRPLGTLYVPRILHLASVGASGMAYDPIKTLDNKGSGQNPFLFLAGTKTYPPKSGFDTHKSVQPQDLIRNVSDDNGGNNLTVVEEMKIHLMRYGGDFGEATTTKEVDLAFKWLRCKFAFQKTDLGAGDISLSEVESESTP